MVMSLICLNTLKMIIFLWEWGTDFML